jgi:monovalent cation:H+ antiporter, CPA1 family
MSAGAGEVTLDAVRLFVVLIGAGSAIALVARRIHLSYSVALVIAGLGVAAVIPHTGSAITPELVLAVLLPGLVFEAAYKTQFEDLRRSLAGALLLAVPGVLIVAGTVALVLSVTTAIPIGSAFVVGAMVAATDPAAVTATFKQLRAPRGLATLVEAESLLNDGTGIVVFTIALEALKRPLSPAEGVVSFVGVVIASVAIGGASGFVASRLVAVAGDHLVEVTTSIVLAYGAYLIADAVHVSGLIAAVVAGGVLGMYGRTHGMSDQAQQAIDTVWESIAFVLTAIVFLLIGLAITVDGVVRAAGPIAWGVVAILVSRAIVVYGLVGGASRVTQALGRGRALPLGWFHVMFWAGLRGAVAVALALALPADLQDRALLQDVTFGIVLFTLVVQGATADLVVRRALGRLSPPE